MNAIIGLCHFCEAHGPRAVFCTFTTDSESHTTESSKSTVQCCGCTSLGPETVLVSRDDDGTIYCSRETVPSPDVTAFLRQAAIRSITCEVSWTKEGGVVYFSDVRGHVLSLTFQLRDTRARGLARWFSLVVLAKDKMLLMNVTPLLSEQMQKISKELQDLATKVFEEEQKVCSQRALRLRTGRNDFGQSRNLVQLTGNEDIFKKLHTHFTWMLKAGALTYSETMYTSGDLLKKLGSKSSLRVPEVSNEQGIPLRALETLLSKEVFRILLYCTLTGIWIVINSTDILADKIIESLSDLLPDIDVYRMRSTSVEVKPEASTCVLEESQNNNFSVEWPGVLPAKCPTLMTRIQNAMANTKFNDSVLRQHVMSLTLEWIGIAKAVKSAIYSSGTKSSAVNQLKKTFGLTPQDELLITYWITLVKI